MTTSEAQMIANVVDTAHYPLSEPGSPGWQGAVSRAWRELADAGCCVLSGFIRSSARDGLQAECAALAPLAYYETETVNVYNIAPGSPLPEDHPGRILMERGNAFVARDRISPGAIIQQLYSSPLFQHFIASCFGLPGLHELADSLAGLCLNVVGPGMEHPWHFDTNEFTVSLLTQEPQDGGIFEYCPGIRSADAENFADVRAVLTGDGRHLTRGLALRPGDLQLFKGRYSLHRVSPVQGELARHTAIFAYSERPGIVGSPERTRQLFGRVLPEHAAAQQSTARIDSLLD